MSSHSSIAALSSSVSTSYQRTGSRLRSSRSRTSNARREPRGAISRITPWPSASCHARRASSVRKMCSPNSGQRATISRSAARSNTITSVGSTATQALIVGSPVKIAMSPMNVPAVGLRDVDVLARLAVDELDPAALDHVERRVAHGVLVEHLAGLEGLAPRRACRATRASRRRGAGTAPRRRGRGSARCAATVVAISSPSAARWKGRRAGARCPRRCGWSRRSAASAAR